MAQTELVTAAIGGDVQATEQLIEAIWPKCYRLAASLTGNRDLAQDAAQESCAIVHCKIGSLRSAAAFDTWLYRIVVRECSRARKRVQNADVRAYDEGFACESTACMDVWRALAALSPALRDVTVLFYFDDLKTDEIARILAVPHATVRTRLARARERLREILEDYDFEPQPMSEVTQHAC
jgi:RNA polymerase sigma-70 factor (ECF subfamily)